jgi:hypothetical protein
MPCRPAAWARSAKHWLQRRHKQIRLNPTSAYVWERCDGRHETYEIAEEMGSELGVAVSENVVLMAVNRLNSERLLEPVSQFA